MDVFHLMVIVKAVSDMAEGVEKDMVDLHSS